MTGRLAASLIAALEEARAQLEVALRDNASWRALRRAIFPASRVPHERALAHDPVYRAWSVIDAAIAGARTQPSVTEVANAAVPASTSTETEPLRIELSHVLEHIRSEAGLGSGMRRGVAVPDAVATPAMIAPIEVAPAPMLPDGEEATVSFVIREPTQPSQQGPNAEAAPPPPPNPAGPVADAEDGAEAEVVIVTRSG